MQCAEWGKMSKSPLHGGAFAVNDRPPRFAGPNAFLLEDVVGGQFAVLSSVLLSSEKPRMLSNASLLTPRVNCVTLRCLLPSHPFSCCFMLIFFYLYVGARE
jgi:hypothetical protein